MKKYLLLLLVLFFILLCGCYNSDIAAPPDEDTGDSDSVTDETPSDDEQISDIPSSEDSQQSEDQEIIQNPIYKIHSEFYIPGLSVEDVITYFNEVCLDAEIIHSGDPSKLQKWTSPIYFYIYGNYTDEDLSVLTNFTNWLNSIDGFPGIFETKDETAANLKIHFCSSSEMLDIMGADFTNMDGGVTFWYIDDVIYDAVICYRTDIDQYLRNSVIMEEIYNGLGPINDTSLRSDSIIYSEFSQPQELTDVDELIIRLLYSSQMVCGMNAEECEAVIRQLYY